MTEHLATSEQGKRKERSLNDIFQEMFEKRVKMGLGPTGAPIRGVRRWIGDILGHDEYERFWKEIMDNNPGREKDD